MDDLEGSWRELLFAVLVVPELLPAVVVYDFSVFRVELPEVAFGLVDGLLTS